MTPPPGDPSRRRPRVEAPQPRDVATPEQWAAAGPVIAAQRQRMHARIMQLEAQLMDMEINIAMRDRQLTAAQDRVRDLEGRVAAMGDLETLGGW